MRYYLFLLIFACSHSSMKDGDRRIMGDDIPTFLRHYKTEKHDDLEFFEKITSGTRVYEVKYEGRNDEEISIKYSEKGEFLEKEVDVEFEDIDKSLASKVKNFISENYSKAKIHEAEWRTDKNQKKFLDVEIRHKSSPTGYWELSFDEEGVYKTRKIEHYDQIETLN